MNKKIFNIGRLFSLLALTSFVLTSCEKDDNSNPTFIPNASSFVLNTPANAENNTYDLASANGLNLTCTQPDYGGVPYVVKYFVQVSLDQTFGSNSNANFRQLDTPYTTASMNVDPLEINNAMLAMYKDANGDVAYPATARQLYVRLLATPVNLAGTPMDSVYSNVITLPKVLATYVAPKLTYPQSLYLVGSSIGNDSDKKYWSYWKKMAPVYGNDPQKGGDFYSIIYAKAGDSFKWGESEGDWRGYKNVAEFDDQASAGISEQTGDGNIVIANAGWYTIYVTTKLGASEVAYTFHIYPAAAYTIGKATGSWADANSDLALQQPATQFDNWISPAFTAAGELRAYIKVPRLDWWRTEFTLFNGSIYWRDLNIIDSWTEKGADYSVACSPGQKLYVDFNLNTGEVK